MGHARALVALADEAAQRRVAREVVSRGLSVRETEALVRREVDAGRSRRRRASVDPNTRAAEERLQLALGTRVRIVRKGHGRTDRSRFRSEEELQRIVRDTDGTGPKDAGT